jgi:hypothetical protein
VAKGCHSGLSAGRGEGGQTRSSWWRGSHNTCLVLSLTSLPPHWIRSLNECVTSSPSFFWICCTFLFYLFLTFCSFSHACVHSLIQHTCIELEKASHVHKCTGPGARHAELWTLCILTIHRVVPLYLWGIISVASPFPPQYQALRMLKPPIQHSVVICL